MATSTLTGYPYNLSLLILLKQQVQGGLPDKIAVIESFEF